MAALTGVSGTGARGSVSPNITIALTGVSARATLGVIQSSTKPGESFSIVVPVPDLALTGVTGSVGTLALQAPLPQLHLTGITDAAGALLLQAPLPQLHLTGVTGSAGTLKFEVPLPQLHLDASGGLTLGVPLPQLQLTGVSGAVGTLVLQAPLPQLSMAGMAEVLGRLTLTYPTPALALAGTPGSVGTLAMQVPVPVLELQGHTESLGSLALQVPLPTLRLTGNVITAGVLAMQVPLPQLQLTGAQLATGAQITAAATAYALQTERLALTRYTNFPFNSFAVFQGRYLGASEDGIFELTGDTDAGVPIAAVARTGVTDLGTSRVKGVDRVYFGFRSDAGESLLLRVTTNESKPRDYAVRPARDEGMHTGRARLGLGVEARYWQFEVQNRGGADFNLDTIDVKLHPLKRRVGAKDA